MFVSINFAKFCNNNIMGKVVGNEGKRSRLRGVNWTSEEKDLFLELMCHSASIVDNKLADTNNIKKKQLEWLKVQKKLKENTGNPRTIEQLKDFWRRMKVRAMKNVSEHKKALGETGDGQLIPSPTDDDQKIMELCPTDFVDTDFNDEINESDSDAINYENSDQMKDGETENNREGMSSASNVDSKALSIEMMKEEHGLKMKYHFQELSHQELRHKLELSILMLEKEKKELEIRVLKKSLE